MSGRVAGRIGAAMVQIIYLLLGPMSTHHFSAVSRSESTKRGEPARRTRLMLVKPIRQSCLFVPFVVTDH